MRRSPTAPRAARGVPKRFGRESHAREIVARQACACRVCGGAIEAGARVLARAWGVDVAHLGCGWPKPEEYAPHACDGPEAPHAWEWACPECDGDVMRAAEPAPSDDLRCAACAAAMASEPPITRNAIARKVRELALATLRGDEPPNSRDFAALVLRLVPEPYRFVP